MASPQAMPGAGQSNSGAAAPSLPDINTQTYPFDTVLRTLDEAAYLNMFSAPNRHRDSAAISGRGGEVIGVRIDEDLHRFDIATKPGLKATNMVGESAGQFRQRWMLMPDNFHALPNREPPPTPLDTSRRQRFVMLDGECSFPGGNRFRGFGTGMTFPMQTSGGRRIWIGAIGDIMEGYGQFAGAIGTYTYGGTLDPQRGFTGELLCRFMDPNGAVRVRGSLPPIRPGAGPEPGVSYIMFRGEKRDANVQTTFSFGPDGLPNGLNVHQELRLFQTEFAVESGALKSGYRAGPMIGRLTANVLFNLLNPGAPGTGLSPIAFESVNQLAFTGEGGKTIGGFEIEGGSGEGRTFNMALPALPEQQALRFGAFAPISKGTGLFQGVKAMFLDNSVVGVAPHATSTTYVLRIDDPDGRFRVRGRHS